MFRNYFGHQVQGNNNFFLLLDKYLSWDRYINLIELHQQAVVPVADFYNSEYSNTKN